MVVAAGRRLEVKPARGEGALEANARRDGGSQALRRSRGGDSQAAETTAQRQRLNEAATPEAGKARLAPGTSRSGGERR